VERVEQVQQVQQVEQVQPQVRQSQDGVGDDDEGKKE
jgi:hypothetical protein